MNGKYKGYNHTFLEVEKKIIDNTSDQYGGAKINDPAAASCGV